MIHGRDEAIATLTYLVLILGLVKATTITIAIWSIPAIYIMTEMRRSIVSGAFSSYTPEEWKLPSFMEMLVAFAAQFLCWPITVWFLLDQDPSFPHLMLSTPKISLFYDRSRAGEVDGWLKQVATGPLWRRPFRGSRKVFFYSEKDAVHFKLSGLSL